MLPFFQFFSILKYLITSKKKYTRLHLTIMTCKISSEFFLPFPSVLVKMEIENWKLGFILSFLGQYKHCKNKITWIISIIPFLVQASLEELVVLPCEHYFSLILSTYFHEFKLNASKFLILSCWNRRVGRHRWRKKHLSVMKMLLQI